MQENDNDNIYQNTQHEENVYANQGFGQSFFAFHRLADFRLAVVWRLKAVRRGLRKVICLSLSLSQMPVSVSLSQMSVCMLICLSLFLSD